MGGGVGAGRNQLVSFFPHPSQFLSQMVRVLNNNNNNGLYFQGVTHLATIQDNLP